MSALRLAGARAASRCGRYHLTTRSPPLSYSHFRFGPIRNCLRINIFYRTPLSRTSIEFGISKLDGDEPSIHSANTFFYNCNLIFYQPAAVGTCYVARFLLSDFNIRLVLHRPSTILCKNVQIYQRFIMIFILNGYAVARRLPN